MAEHFIIKSLVNFFLVELLKKDTQIHTTKIPDFFSPFPHFQTGNNHKWLQLFDVLLRALYIFPPSTTFHILKTMYFLVVKHGMSKKVQKKIWKTFNSLKS